MARALTHAQLVQNAAFLAVLRRTGNARLAARELGLHHTTFIRRRARHAAFAAECDATLSAAHAAFRLAGGKRMPESAMRAADPAALAIADGSEWRDTLRTKGGEPTIVRTASGRLQLRLAPPGRMTRAAEQAFLAALAATANVALATAATGYRRASIYAKRKASPAFARAMDRARKIGVERLETILLEAADRAFEGEGPDAAWEHSLDANPVPRMTALQALQQLAMHRRTAQHDEVRQIMRRRWPWEVQRVVLQARLQREQHRHEQAAAREKRAEARAKRFEQTGRWRHPNEPATVQLPPLDQVTGWSKADPDKKPHREGGTLFGGWRIGDWRRRG
jgi:hypothetical protein